MQRSIKKVTNLIPAVRCAFGTYRHPMGKTPLMSQPKQGFGMSSLNSAYGQQTGSHETFQQGADLLKEGKLQEASDRFREAIKIGSGRCEFDDDSHFDMIKMKMSLAEAYAKMHNHKKALEVYKESVESLRTTENCEGLSGRVHYAYAIALEKAGELADALVNFETTIVFSEKLLAADEPDILFEAHVRAGSIRADSLKDFKRAQSHFLKAVLINKEQDKFFHPRTAYALTQAANCAIHNGQMDKAQDYFRWATSVCKKGAASKELRLHKSNFLYNKGLYFLKQNDYEGSAKFFEESVELSEASSDNKHLEQRVMSLEWLALAHLLRSDISAAKEVAAKCIKLSTGFKSDSLTKYGRSVLAHCESIEKSSDLQGHIIHLEKALMAYLTA